MTTASTTWAAPVARRPIVARVELPGSKSLTNRYLVLAAVADGPTRLHGMLRARDTDLMLAGLSAMGVGIDLAPDVAPHHSPPRESRDPTPPTHETATRIPRTPGSPSALATTVVVTPQPLRGPATVDCGLAGTVMRFLPALAAGATGPVAFTGDPEASRRPLAPLLTALRELGARIDGDGVPLTVHGAGPLAGGAVSVDASTSSQFLSALLLAAPTMSRGLRVHATGERLISQPHIDMTLAALRDFGAQADQLDPMTWQVAPGGLQGRTLAIEPDLTNAAVFLAAGALTGGAVTVPHWPASSMQVGAEAPGLLARMGATVTRDLDTVTVGAPTRGGLRGLDADLSHAGELVPTIAAIAALATTPSRLTGIAHLAGHETDRLAALTAEINHLGGHAVRDDDGLTIEPRPLHAGVVRCYADHRMAMFGALLALLVEGVELDDVGATSKTLPDFPELWNAVTSGA